LKNRVVCYMLFSFWNVICFSECIVARMSFVFLNVLVNKRNDTKIFMKYIFMFKPKQLFIIIYVNAYVKRVSPRKTNNNILFRYGKIRVCDDRIRHSNHLRANINCVVNKSKQFAILKNLNVHKNVDATAPSK